MDNTLPETSRSVGIRYGVFMAFASILVFLAMVITGFDTISANQWLSYPVYIVFLILAHKYLKENNADGFMSYGQGMYLAFWLSMTYSVIYSAFTYIYVKFIDSGFIESMKEIQLEKFKENGMSDQQIEQAMNITDMIMKPEPMFFMSIIGGIISVVISALIVTIFTHKKNPDQVI